MTNCTEMMSMMSFPGCGPDLFWVVALSAIVVVAVWLAFGQEWFVLAEEG